MATSAQPKISITRTPSPQQTARDQWVAMVDDYIDKESLDILKLSVGSELNETQCQKIKIASDLYCELAQHYTDPEMRLSRFIYALEKLGHRRYGCRAIRHLEERYRPAPFDLAKLKVDMNKFILLQRLTVLCCTLPKDRYDRFSDHLAKKVLANPKKYNTPWKILRKALKKNLITSENHLDVLEEALIEVELSERQIKEAFENFHSIAGFGCPRNSATSDSSPSPFKSPPKKSNTDSPSTSSGRIDSPLPKSTSSSGKNCSHQEVSSSHSPSPTTVVEDQSPQQASETTPLLGAGAQQQAVPHQEQGTQPEEQRPPNSSNKKKKCLIRCVCCLTFLILVVLMAGAAVLTGFAAKQYKANQPSIQHHHGNSTVILAELNHFYTESLSVTEDTEHLHDFHHDINVYEAETKCSNLVNMTTYTVQGSDHKYTSTMYALAGSAIHLHICGSTNQTYSTDRLELLLLNHLDDDNDFPNKVNFFVPGLDGKKACKYVNFDLPTTDYYTLSLLPPSTQMSFEFELTYDIKRINPHLLAEYTVTNYTLHNDQDSYKFTLTTGIEYSCFVAEIREIPNIKGDVHIQLHYGNRWAGLIAGVVLFVTSCFIATVLVIRLAVRKRHYGDEAIAD